VGIRLDLPAYSAAVVEIMILSMCVTYAIIVSCLYDAMFHVPTYKDEILNQVIFIFHSSNVEPNGEKNKLT